jgi:hypothetical protein
VVTRPVAHQHEVVVAVDQPRHGHPAVQVNGLRLFGELLLCGREAVADVDDEPAANGDHAGHRPRGVHRVDLSVVEYEVGVT